MELLDGKQTAAQIKEQIKLEIDHLVESGGKRPHLAAILVGDNPASQVYVRNKIRACDKVGMRSTLVRMDDDISEEELIAAVRNLNNDKDIDGYIVQLPLPRHINEEKVNLVVDPKKDVDGFHPVNFGRMALGLNSYLPATPFGIMKMIEHYNIKTEGKQAVIIGRSNIVGTPMALLLSKNNYPGNCTVTLTHSRTADLESHTRQADILVAAIGSPGFVTADMVKEGAVVIDVGINRVDDPSKKSGYRLAGDVDFENVSPKCSYITPVPGGVGPMTITGLLLNTLASAKGQIYNN